MGQDERKYPKHRDGEEKGMKIGDASKAQDRQTGINGHVKRIRIIKRGGIIAQEYNLMTTNSLSQKHL